MPSSLPSAATATSDERPSFAWYEATAAAQIHAEQLQQLELFNGRAAMLGLVIGVLTEALTGQGILQQIGLGLLFNQG